jgi:hypothetical protein
MAQQRLDLPADPGTCRVVRHLVSELSETLAAPLVEDIALVADELVTYSLLSGWPADPLTFEILANRHEVTVAVERTTEAFRPRNPAARDVAGFGLLLVDDLADRWGIENGGRATRTWASFAVPSPADAQVMTEAREVAVAEDERVAMTP